MIGNKARIVPRKTMITLIVILAILLVGFYFYGSYKNSSKSNIVSKPSATISVNYTNFAKVISENSIVKALPEDSALLLEFYNWKNDTKNIEKTYTLRKSKVTEERVSNPDITLSLNSKYLSQLTNKNFCNIIQQANKARDLEMNSSLSKVALAWKFRAILKYKECFGM